MEEDAAVLEVVIRDELTGEITFEQTQGCWDQASCGSIWTHVFLPSYGAPEGLREGPVFSVAGTVSDIEQVTSKHLLTNQCIKRSKLV